MRHDFQKSKCYSWEDLHVHKRDSSHVPFEHAQGLVNYVWAEEGLRFPPRISALPPQASRVVADASRLEIRINPKGVKTTILLHEISHSLTSTHEGESAAHGERFVGVFMMLLSKYAGFSLPELMYTAKSAGVAFNFKGKVI